VSHDAHKWLK
jgi:hypothetical protein